eukprot:TRINITY_DN5593_c0_g1_i1.p2 TRINITY_DN5593_c0_g1~~TRINITY_DN5593_c0_g1_i1.p2  ORF type:complete len:115 (-),score=21.35 TRINITY_DN5593_c0_g1_i1:40-384(-)
MSSFFAPSRSVVHELMMFAEHPNVHQVVCVDYGTTLHASRSELAGQVTVRFYSHGLSSQLEHGLQTDLESTFGSMFEGAQHDTITLTLSPATIAPQLFYELASEIAKMLSLIHI